MKHEVRSTYDRHPVSLADDSHLLQSRYVSGKLRLASHSHDISKPDSVFVLDSRRQLYQKTDTWNGEHRVDQNRTHIGPG